jgi:hypothetical protein
MTVDGKVSDRLPAGTTHYLIDSSNFWVSYPEMEAVQGNKGTREQGNKGTREQGNKGTREQGNLVLFRSCAAG